MGKPVITFRSDGGMADLYLAAIEALQNAGLKEQVRDLHESGLEAPSFKHLKTLVQQYVIVEMK